jgi:hypothetical protein
MNMKEDRPHAHRVPVYERDKPLVDLVKTKLVGGVATAIGLGIGTGLVALAVGGVKWIPFFLALLIALWSNPRNGP